MTYTLVDVTGGKLLLNGNVVYVAALIDFETTPTLSMTVRVTDSGGLSLTQLFSIAVGNVNERPTAITISSSSVAVCICTRLPPPPFPSALACRCPSLP
jgi:hypothetical protein